MDCVQCLKKFIYTSAKHLNRYVSKGIGELGWGGGGERAACFFLDSAE